MSRVLSGFLRTDQGGGGGTVMAVGNIQGRHFAEQFRDAGNISRLVNDPERMAETVVFRDEVIFRMYAYAYKKLRVK